MMPEQEIATREKQQVQGGSEQALQEAAAAHVAKVAVAAIKNLSSQW